MQRVLLLGGTTEASDMAQALARAGVPAVFSYAGRTEAPLEQPLPTRVGGFGGVPGLCSYLVAERITHVIDATHPFAAQMSQHALQACGELGLPLLALERPPWQAQSGDRWQHVPDLAAALAALPSHPARVFLAIGRQHVQAFLDADLHWYLLRLVDPGFDVPTTRGAVVIDRGPFTLENDLALLRQHRISHVVAKNAGGVGAAAKLAAARELGYPVILVNRPALPHRHTVGTVQQAMQWLGATAVHEAERGV
ncbi:cobalt-precorrin-6A reductase [Hydrogenophaga sp.]|uniref:cobalt-precorrin-6A reductase n=1 Tax=Hydrogenophaga sp. TaxID=1904254 RepID=UPI0027300F6C|nr:cobalt-precorrin-6A reductase [Hydrogenophaga sp.]MDP2015701.1 cobalt-precorrin-6A reductase [Hydrogenophaga sp.]MDP3164777.1 cobalt-precorrin-6A reductase [Hydrogenophaga sp.]MDP3810677.1 cobalt-precorrin-6A reductase [Hydrogenophaga sp.]